jgi:two-component system, NtrC family, response regulator AtoC
MDPISSEETIDLEHLVATAKSPLSLVLYAPDGARVLPLPDGARFVVGRTADADIVIPERSLSRTHARIRADNGVVIVEDLQSKNGTKINGEPIHRAPLRPGDELTMGSVAAVLLQPESASRWVEQPADGKGTDGPVIESPAMIVLYETVERFASSNIPVLIQGETGVGKEVVARSLHDKSDRRDHPMACINCGAIPEQLVEDTLFGHERGAFTGALAQHKGVFETAHGGTVFLDEIGELPLAAQAALLRVLEAKRITRVGSPKEIEVDVRIVAATNKNLEEMCEDGGFRWDLLYRLNAVTLKIPPLRQRTEEIPALARHFLEHIESQRRAVAIDAVAMDHLVRYTWPGNVRELANVIQRASVMAAGRTIGADDLPERVRTKAPHPDTADLATRESRARALEEDDGEAADFKSQMTRAEIQILVNALERTAWNQTEAAHRLQMPLRTLVHKIKKLGIQELISQKRSEKK